MSKFTVGEEVRYDGDIYVISSRVDGPVPRYRLLASRPGGTRFQLVEEDKLQEIESYLESDADTDRY